MKINIFERLIKAITERKSNLSPFWMKYTRTVHQRGVVAYIMEANYTRINDAGIVEVIPTENGNTIKIVLLPGDDHSYKGQITEQTLVAYEPLNRRYREYCKKLRKKLTSVPPANKAKPRNLTLPN